MSEQRNNNSEDTYDVLHKNFSLLGDEPVAETEEADVKNSGEIYFSAGPSQSASASQQKYDFERYESHPKASAAGTSARPNGSAAAPVRSGSSGQKPAAKKTASKSSGKASGAKKGSSSKKKNSSISLLLAGVIVIFVLIASVVIRIPVMGCVSDILAIDRDSTEIRVIIDYGTRTKEVINILGQKKLIYSTGFCKAVSKFLGYPSDEIFPAGTYYLSPDMGLEGMLKTILSAGATDETVKVTFPEGFTVDQIIAKLALSGVASENALYAALNDDSLFEEYEFFDGFTDRESRYHALEGYLYPDTYEFYVDENPISVFKRFLDNFNDKWTENFAADYDSSVYSIDDIITVASILEKEAKDAEQMPLIASILYNRLASSSFPWINCDSTKGYIEAQKDKLEAAGTYVFYLNQYDTYQQMGLPVGPICNPGSDAIAAALSPDATDYYYFLHDEEGKIYTARTEAEHIANQQYMNAGGE